MNEAGSLAQTAEVVGVSVKTLRRWIKDQLLEAEMVPGKTGNEYRVRVKDAMALKEKNSDVLLRSKRQPAIEQLQELVKIREVLEAQAKLIEDQKKAMVQQTQEIHDLRGQLHQVQQAIIKALPAPQPQEQKKAWWKFGR
jgi:predicted site-specific integrase-resolvase